MARYKSATSEKSQNSEKEKGTNYSVISPTKDIQQNSM